MATPHQKPIVSFPTPNIRDSYFVEFVNPTLPYYSQFEYGALHPDQTQFPGARLTYRAPVPTQDGEDKLARMVWCSARGAQEVYNTKVSYAEGDIDFPIHTRKYVFLRSLYEEDGPATKLQPLGTAIGLQLDSGGINYAPDSFGHVDLIFTGGGGTGMAGFGTVSDGVFTGVYLTDGGINYTSAPVVTALVGAGLAVTVLMQAQEELLIAEESGPLDGDLASIWVEVVRMYETLPGPEISTPRFDETIGANRTTYEQRVDASTPPNPVAAVEIVSIAVGGLAIVTTNDVHNLPVGPFPVRISGIGGGTPDMSGFQTATRIDDISFSLSIGCAVSPTPNTGFMSPLKNGQVIIESYVKPDDDSGTVVGTLITVTAELPGREMSAPDFDSERAAHVNEYRQMTHYGFAPPADGSTYKGQKVESVELHNQGSAMQWVLTKTILLPGDPVTVPSFDEETGAKKQLIRTRVSIGTLPDTIGAVHSLVPTRKFTQSKVIEENAVVGVLTSVTSTLPASRREVHDGNAPMPAIVNVYGAWTIGNDGYVYHGPFLGPPANGNYTILLHGVAAPALVDFSYTFSKDPSVPVISNIFAPISGRSGVGLPINGQTLHYSPLTVDGSYTVIENPSSGPASGVPKTIEYMPASIPKPSSYITGDEYLHSYTDRPLEGGPDGIWERRKTFFVAT